MPARVASSSFNGKYCPQTLPRHGGTTRLDCVEQTSWPAHSPHPTRKGQRNWQVSGAPRTRTLWINPQNPMSTKKSQVVRWSCATLYRWLVPIAVALPAANQGSAAQPGSVVGWGDKVITYAQPGTRFTAISAGGAGGNHSLALKADGTVVAWGDNSHGQCVAPANLSGAVAISAGWWHSLALRAGGIVATWGDNSYGQCSAPAGLSGVVAIAAGGGHSLALKADGTVVAWGDNSHAQCVAPANLSSVVAITAGYLHSLALKAGGTVVGWGDNSSGQSTVPANLSGVVAIAAGELHSLALKGDGTVVAWGDNRYGQSTVPANLSGVVAIAAGYLHSLALMADGTVVAWGDNSSGQSTVPANLSGVVAIAAGYLHSLALMADGTLTAWGDNFYGQSTVPASLSGVLAISAGDHHSLALKTDGTVVAWGPNDSGQSTVPANLSGVAAIAAGGAHSLALKTDGTLTAWGNNFNGQCTVPASLSGVLAISAGGLHSLALKTDGTVVAWGANGWGQSAVPANLSGVVAIAAGELHSLALKSDGTVVAWGYNDLGQSAVPANLRSVVAITAGGRHNLGLKSDGTVVAWGDNSSGQSTVPANLSGVVAIAAGYLHSLALKADGTVVAWGRNNSDQGTVPANLSNVVAIAAGYGYSLAIVAGSAARDATPPSGMALVPAGSFTMGNCMDPSEGYSTELPLHTVYVSAFYMDKYLVTKALWGTVYQWAISHGYSFDYPGSGKAANHPVPSIDWDDCVKWCNARSEQEGRVPAYYTDGGLSVRYRAGHVAPYVNWSSGYRLPTEAEWEKGARGGLSGQRFPWGDTIDWSHANYNANVAGSYAYDINPTGGLDPVFNDGVYPYTSPVGYFAPNGYGLYDMAGNVWEWCWDWCGAYSSGSQTDARGPTSGSLRVCRGGSWVCTAFCCRAAGRNGYDPTFRNDFGGFRSVLPPAIAAQPPGLVVAPDGATIFHSIQVGGIAEGVFTVSNGGGGSVSGTASAAQPFSVFGGASYILAPGQSQTVTVRYSPTAPGQYSDYVTFTGGTSPLTRQVIGSAFSDPTPLTGTIAGQVTHSGQPVNGAAIMVIRPGANLFNGGSSPGTLSGVIGGQAGKYSISGLAPNAQYHVLATPPMGQLQQFYMAEVDNVAVTAGLTTTVSIELTGVPPESQPPTVTPQQTPVVLVRGLGPDDAWHDNDTDPNSQRGYWSDLRTSLLAAGFKNIWDCNQPDSDPHVPSFPVYNGQGHVINGENSIDANARSLEYYVQQKALQFKRDNRFFPPSINIVAHSMGGLITREAISLTGSGVFTVYDPSDQKISTVRVNKVVMLGTPNAGSVLADFAEQGFGFSPFWQPSWASTKNCTTVFVRNQFNGVYNSFPANTKLYLVGGGGGPTSDDLVYEGMSTIMNTWDPLLLLTEEWVTDGAVTWPSLQGMFHKITLAPVEVQLLKSIPLYPAAPPKFFPYLDHSGIRKDPAATSWVIARLTETVSMVSEKMVSSVAGFGASSPLEAASNSVSVQQLESVSGALPSRTSVTVPVVCEETTALQFQLITSDTNAILRLNTPSGVAINPVMQQPNTNVQYSAIMSTSEVVVANYRITSPTGGVWTATIDGSSVTSTQVAYNLSVFGNSSVTMLPQTGSVFNHGQDVVVACALLDLSASPPAPVLNASITATIRFPDGSTNRLVLLDDGSHNDGAATDGLFAAVLAGGQQPGQYSISYRALGTNTQGQALQRVAASTFSVSSGNASLLGDPVYETVDTSGDGIGNFVGVKCWVSAQRAGIYVVSCDLVDSTGTNRLSKSAQFTATAAGPTAVSLIFDLAEIPTLAGSVNYHIENLQLFEIASAGPAWLDAYHGSSSVTLSSILTVPTNTSGNPLPAGAVGAPYSTALHAMGGTSPYSWSLLAGGLPPGLTLSTSGTIRGTPSAAGQASFIVQVTGNNGLKSTNTLSMTITLPLSPVVDFSAYPTNGLAPLVVNFDEASAGTITNRLWSFGDGGTSSDANPSHTYASAGIFSVSLSVVGPAGSNSLTRSSLVTVTAPADNLGPSIVIASPASGTTVHSAQLTVSGTATDFGLGNAGISSVTVNGVLATGGVASGTNTANWSAAITLNSGQNTIAVVATDANGNATTQTVAVTFTSLLAFSVTTAAAPVAGGVTTGGGSFGSGMSVAVTATPISGYHFVNWTENGSQVGTTANYSFILSGNRSLTANFAANAASTYTVIASVSPSGTGKATGGGTFKAGTSRTVRSTPNNGYIFANWTENGTVINVTATYTSLLNGNRNLVANFIPNPFGPVAGTYNGLFFETNGIRQAASGSSSVTITAKGAYSGSLLVGGKRVSVSGQFDAAGSATKLVKRGGNLGSVTVSLQLDLAQGSDVIMGIIGDGSTWSAPLVGNRAVFDGKSKVAPQIGAYTIVFPGTNGVSTLPAGDGYGTVAVDKAGRIRFSGSLADGTKLSQVVPVSKHGDWPLYASLYGSQGSVLGWLAFGTNDLGGSVVWIKPRVSRGKYYPDGFATGIQAFGLSYTPPLKGNNVLTTAEGSLVLSSSDLAQAFTNRFTIGANNRVTGPPGSKLGLTFTPSTGLFRGTVLNPATSKAISFSGVVLQKTNTGRGFFLDSNLSGKASLE
jgi:alpha-tubulin suppressor-like RCC1 family protein/PKD repeat protein